MDFTFKNKKITGILSIVPEEKVFFIDEIENYSFSLEKCMALKKVMGFNERRIVRGNICSSDLCLEGMIHLIENKYIDKNDIVALIFITQTPDQFMPPTSAILHGKLGLRQKALCFDINQGCTGYIYGLLQAFMILSQVDSGKVVLMTADTLSRCASKHDRNVWPLIGDSGAITIIENSNNEGKIHIKLKSNGSKSDSLSIPAGGFRIRSSEETRELKEYPDGNKRADEHLRMNGSAVFIFTQKEVPKLINELIQLSGMKNEDIDYFMLHQPNKFILQKIARKLNISETKMPNNIVELFGSPSSASIPLTICYNIKNRIQSSRMKICMAGFGVGLSWGGIIMDMGPLEFCDIIEI